MDMTDEESMALKACIPLDDTENNVPPLTVKAAPEVSKEELSFPEKAIARQMQISSVLSGVTMKRSIIISEILDKPLALRRRKTFR